MFEVLAPAKLTLSLRITGVRPDGYHTVDAEMAALDFSDRLEIAAGESGLRMLDEAGNDLHGVARPGENLVECALALCGRQARVTVHKRIPVGAGLGGGSADAAAVLRWAGFGDIGAAASIGADVAFCLFGGRARVRGIGEIVEPRPYVREQYTLLLAPAVCDTAAVYAAWDELGGPVGGNGNDLEAAALRVVPELAVWRDRLGDATGITPRLAGSGSTWFVPGAHPGPSRVVATTVEAAAASLRGGRPPL